MYFSPIGNIMQYVDSPQLTILGAASAYAVSIARSDPPRAGKVTLISTAIAAFPTLLFCLMATLNTSNTEMGALERLWSTVVFSLPTLLWLVVLGLWSISLLRVRAS